MSKKLKIDLHHAVLPDDLKGRITRPIVGINDSAFQYTPAIRTNLAETFRRVRERLAKEAA